MFDLPEFELKTEKVYSVLELNTAVRKLIHSEFPEYIWVYGEIKDLRISKNKKHIYFDLVQKHPEADEIIARVSAAIFESRKAAIFKKIEDTKGAFELKNDIEVKFLCEVDLYPKSGQYNLIIVDIDPVYTIGKFAQNRERIIAALRQMGLLERNKIVSFPLVPLNIGLVTAFDSAAYHDFINELKISKYGFRIMVYDAHMQGKNVESDIVDALKYFNAFGSDDLDVIVITRGGGSTADLSWFDNKNIAYSIAHSRFPVITALGHQINISVTDLVAHTALKTPTKAAQFLVEKVRQSLEEVTSIGEHICHRAEVLLDESRRFLETGTYKINSLVSRYFQDHREQLVRNRSLIMNNAVHILQRLKRTKEEELKFLKRVAQETLKKRKETISHIEDKVKYLDPQRVLKRGYSISYKDGKIIRSSKELKRGDRITTVFFKGEAISSVEETKEEE